MCSLPKKQTNDTWNARYIVPYRAIFGNAAAVWRIGEISVQKNEKARLRIKYLLWGTLSQKGETTMEITPQQYDAMCKKASPNSPLLKDCIWAFCTGGAICVLGEALRQLYLWQGLAEKEAGLAVSMSLIALSALTTGLGWYCKLAAHAGAGTLVPITGFANAVVSPAIEFRSEGFVLGVGAKMFLIAGPVIVYGTLASVIYGLILFFTGAA